MLEQSNTTHEIQYNTINGPEVIIPKETWVTEPLPEPEKPEIKDPERNNFSSEN